VASTVARPQNACRHGQVGRGEVTPMDAAIEDGPAG